MRWAICANRLDALRHLVHKHGMVVPPDVQLPDIPSSTTRTFVRQQLEQAQRGAAPPSGSEQLPRGELLARFAPRVHRAAARELAFVTKRVLLPPEELEWIRSQYRDIEPPHMRGASMQCFDRYEGDGDMAHPLREVLEEAFAAGGPKLVDQLIRRRDDQGRAAVHLASSVRQATPLHEHPLTVLVSFGGANVLHLVDRMGRTPRDYARNTRVRDFAQMFEQHCPSCGFRADWTYSDIIMSELQEAEKLLVASSRLYTRQEGENESKMEGERVSQSHAVPLSRLPSSIV